MAKFVSLILLAFSARLSAAVAPRPTCVVPDDLRQTRTTVSSSHASCFLIEVKPEDPVQLVVEQPIDFEIRLLRKNSLEIIDSFQFGTETITIVAPGQCRIEIHPVGDYRGAAISVLVSWKRLPPRVAPLWRDAEESATRSKLSRKSADIEASLALWRKIGDSSAVVRTELKEGDAALGEQNREAAGRHYEQALQDCEAMEDTRCVAEAANNSGYVSCGLGDYDTSLSRLKQATKAWEQLGRADYEGQTLSNLGLLFWQTGDYQHAISWFNRASDLLRTRDKLAYARVLNNLGLCYQSMAENEKARSEFQMALGEFVRRRSPHEEATAGLNLGRTWLVEGDTTRAREMLDRALRTADQNSARSDRADILDSIGQTLIAQHRPAEAAVALHEALDIHRAVRNRRIEASDLHYLGVAAMALGDHPAARQYFTDALTIRRESVLRDAAVDSLSALADLEHTDGHNAAARDFADEALRLMESVRVQVPGPALRASYYSRRRKFFDLLIELDMATAANAVEAGFLAAERGRGRALLDLLAEGTLVPDTPPELLSRRTAIGRRIDLLAVRLSGAGPAAGEPLRREAESLVAEDEQIEAVIRQSLTDRRVSAPLASVADLQRVLPPDAAVLEYYLGETQSYLWIVRRNDIALFHLPARAKIEAESAPVLKLFPLAFERVQDAEKQRAFNQALRRLSRMLLGSVESSELPTRLILIPDGVLTRIPFAALELPDSRRLGLTHDLVQATSAAYLTAGREPRRPEDFPKAFFAITDPVFSRTDPRVRPGRPSSSSLPDLPRLPFNQDAETVAALVPASRRRILSGFSVSRARLYAEPLEDYAILHFSTHAFIDDRIPELSRIALSMVGPAGQPWDGFLRPAQISELHLNGSAIVLSACETALGRQVLGEGLAGFTASLFHAGAAQLVLALSDVDAEGSAELLARTYRNIFGGPHASLEHALTLARRNLAHSARWSDPWYWASFTVYGRPTPEPKPLDRGYN